MIYSYETLRNMVRDGLIVPDASDDQIQAASIDVTLGNNFKVPVSDKPILKLGKDIPEYKDAYGSVIIKPHSFILATTKEKIKIRNTEGAWIEGKSSIGRSGLFIQNAGWIAPGFEGEITLELYNANDYCLEIEEGLSIGQIVVSNLDAATIKPYDGKYKNQTGATAPIDGVEKMDFPVKLKIYPTNVKIANGAVYSGLLDSLISEAEVATFETKIFNEDKYEATIRMNDKAIAALKNNLGPMNIISAPFMFKLSKYIPEDQEEFFVYADLYINGYISSTGFRYKVFLKRDLIDVDMPSHSINEYTSSLAYTRQIILKVVGFEFVDTTTNACWGSGSKLKNNK